MLKYLALAASLAVASCGAAPAYAIDCPQGTISITDAIASLETYGDRFEVIGIFPIPGTNGTSHGCLMPDSSQYVGKFKKDREA